MWAPHVDDLLMMDEANAPRGSITAAAAAVVHEQIYSVVEHMLISSRFDRAAWVMWVCRLAAYPRS